MASISHCRTLRARNVLLRHQMLHAMHLTFDRPAFRPQPPEVLGTGVRWAFDGKPGHGVLRGPDGAVVDPAAIEGMPEFLRKANQLTEMMVLAGPGDEEIVELREHYGYRPEAMTEVEASRLEWEASYVDILADHPASKAELRVRLQARELLHEHQALFQALIGEYRINLEREVGYDPERPNVSRRRMVEFADAVPSLRIAVDLKVELFRGAAKPWTMNAIHDIDALSKAVPYCHVVVPDREMASLLSRSRAAERHGTQIIAALPDLPDALPDLAGQAQNAAGDRTGWDWPGRGTATVSTGPSWPAAPQASSQQPDRRHYRDRKDYFSGMARLRPRTPGSARHDAAAALSRVVAPVTVAIEPDETAQAGLVACPAAGTRKTSQPPSASRAPENQPTRYASDQQPERPPEGRNAARIAKASGYTHR